MSAEAAEVNKGGAGQPGAELVPADGSVQRRWLPSLSLGRAEVEVAPVPLVDLENYSPQVAEQAMEVFDEYVDPLIARAPIGEWMRQGAQLRTATVWLEGAEARQEDDHGFSERKKQKYPNKLNALRNKEVDEFSQVAGRVGVGKIVDLDISPEDATQEAFGLLGVRTFRSEIDGCMVADGTEVARAIEAASDPVPGSESLKRTSDDEEKGIMLARNDTYWEVTRNGGDTGKTADTVFLVTDPREDTHYIGATTMLSVESPGTERRTRNRVTAVALNSKVASRAVRAMQETGMRQIVAHGDAHHEVLSRVREDLVKLDEWASDTAAIGERASQPVQAWTPDQPLALTDGNIIVDSELVE